MEENTSGSGWDLSHSYADLPAACYAEVLPVPVSAPRLILFNRALAAGLGLDAAEGSALWNPALWTGNTLPPGARPLAQAYAGHQFGHFTMLGDGRAVLLGEQRDPAGRLWDIQLKGSGQTPYSRRGDGRAALGPMLREYLMGEAMHALGVPTTRGLAVAATGEPVWRETPLPGAILTRVAASHIRVGTFQYLAARRDPADLKTLADYTIRRHYPEAAAAGQPILALLESVMERQAALLAAWMRVGFIHGVMNTDNMALSGETLDYGPCAFMDRYDPATVFSSIDTGGRYAFGQQPGVAHWNLIRFAETLIPLLHPEEKEAIALAEAALQAYPDRYHRHWLREMGGKLGLAHTLPDDARLIRDLHTWMYRQEADYTRTWRLLAEDRLSEDPIFRDPAFEEWQLRWQSRLAEENDTPDAQRARMRAHCPAYIPRNHRVEEALDAAVEGRMEPIKALLEVLASPYERQPDADRYFHPPDQEAQRGYQTFCGT